MVFVSHLFLFIFGNFYVSRIAGTSRPTTDIQYLFSVTKIICTHVYVERIIEGRFMSGIHLFKCVVRIRQQHECKTEDKFPIPRMNADADKINTR